MNKVILLIVFMFIFSSMEAGSLPPNRFDPPDITLADDSTFLEDSISTPGGGPTGDDAQELDAVPIDGYLLLLLITAGSLIIYTSHRTKASGSRAVQ